MRNEKCPCEGEGGWRVIETEAGSVGDRVREKVARLLSSRQDLSHPKQQQVTPGQHTTTN